MKDFINEYINIFECVIKNPFFRLLFLFFILLNFWLLFCRLMICDYRDYDNNNKYEKIIKKYLGDTYIKTIDNIIASDLIDKDEIIEWYSNNYDKTA